MRILADIANAVERYNKHVDEQVELARIDKKTKQEILARWREIKASIPTVETPTGIKLPRLALPNVDEPGEIARYLYGEGLPGEFPFLSSAYRQMYLEKEDHTAEEPTRLFAGLGLA